MRSCENISGIPFPDTQKKEKISRLELEKLLDFPLIDPPPTAPKEVSAWDYITEIAETIMKDFVPDEFKNKNGEIPIFVAQKEISKFGQTAFKSMIGHGLKLAATLTSRKIVNRIETHIVKPTVPEYAKGFEEAVLEIAKDPENLIVVISSHEGYGDGAGSAIIAKYITGFINKQRSPENKFRGFILPIAASLGSGHQSASWQKLIEPIKKRALEYNLHMMDLVRKKDKVQYDLHGSNEKYARELLKIIKYEDCRIDDGIYLFLAGNMQEGRRKKGKFPGSLSPFGHPINGLREFNCKSFHGLVNSTELKHHRKVIIIPVGSYGAFDIFDPGHNSYPTPKALKELVRSNPKSLLTVKVGLPVSYDDIVLEARAEAKQQNGSEEITSRNIDHKFGYMLAGLLPPEAQGYYRSYKIKL